MVVALFCPEQLGIGSTNVVGIDFSRILCQSGYETGRSDAGYGPGQRFRSFQNRDAGGDFGRRYGESVGDDFDLVFRQHFDPIGKLQHYFRLDHLKGRIVDRAKYLPPPRIDHGSTQGTSSEPG